MKEFYRAASDEELQFFQQTLYPLQDSIFEVVSIYAEKLYLTGGTALARFYFNHRLSEDLDFFTTTDDLRRLVNDLSAQLDKRGFWVEIDALEVYFARIYIVTAEARLKIEFAREFNLVGRLLKTDKNIFINDLEDIGANKVTAFEDRAQIKDIIDLYYITQTIPLERLFELADLKRVPIAYENLLTINVAGISGQALITSDLPEKTLIDFVHDLKSKTEAEIKKKEAAALKNIQTVVEKLLWDFPRETRNINPYSRPVLQQRLKGLKLPEQMALKKVLLQK
jgi:hypothetical protein